MSQSWEILLVLRAAPAPVLLGGPRPCGLPSLRGCPHRAAAAAPWGQGLCLPPWGLGIKTHALDSPKAIFLSGWVQLDSVDANSPFIAWRPWRNGFLGFKQPIWLWTVKNRSSFKNPRLFMKEQLNMGLSFPWRFWLQGFLFGSWSQWDLVLVI